MLWHTRFVVTNLFGASVSWSRQRRGTDGTTWWFALRRHWGHTLIGLVWGLFMWQLNRYLFWWFTPVFTGMVLSVPLSVVTSRLNLGARARKLGLLLTPEETEPPLELVSLRAQMKIHELTDDTTAPARRTQVSRKPYWILTSMPSMFRCYAKNGSTRFMPNNWPGSASATPGSPRARRKTAGRRPGPADGAGTTAPHDRCTRNGLAAPAILDAARRIARAVVAGGHSGIQPPRLTRVG